MRNERVPRLVQWTASKNFEETTNQIEDKIDPYQGMAYPEHKVVPSGRHKDVHDLKKDGRFYEEYG